MSINSFIVENGFSFFFVVVVVTVGFTSESASVTVDEAVGPVLLMVQSSNIAANTSVNLYYRTSSREATGMAYGGKGFKEVVYKLYVSLLGC